MPSAALPDWNQHAGLWTYGVEVEIRHYRYSKSKPERIVFGTVRFTGRPEGAKYVACRVNNFETYTEFDDLKTAMAYIEALYALEEGES